MTSTSTMKAFALQFRLIYRVIPAADATEFKNAFNPPASRSHSFSGISHHMKTWCGIYLYIYIICIFVYLSIFILFLLTIKCLHGIFTNQTSSATC